MKISNYEIKYYEKKGDLTLKRYLIEAYSKKEAFDEFKKFKPNTMIISVKSISEKQIDKNTERILGNRNIP